MKVNQATHSVGVMCRLLKVSRSGFYAWLERPTSARARADLALTARVEAIHRRSKGVYGSPMIHAELADDYGIRVGRKRVARLMRAAGLRGATLRRYVVTTLWDPHAERAIDLVERKFYTDGPDRLWVADITYVPTWAGFLYLAHACGGSQCGAKLGQFNPCCDDRLNLGSTRATRSASAAAKPA